MIVALLVLLILGMVGAVFIVVVARNLVNARHANRVLTADNYAQSGILFADAQLTYSPQGADWRPPLQATLAVQPTEPREAARYNAAVAANGLTQPNPNDPDSTYLAAGFTRYNTGAGRYLLRLTYTPVLLQDASGSLYDPVIGATGSGTSLQGISPVAVPPGRYIKIEAIGREGVITPSDPTTYTNNRTSVNTQAYLVAYKPIGITDYDRFETNPDKRSDIANLGVVSQFYTSDPNARIEGEIVTPAAYDIDFNAQQVPLIYPVLTTYGANDAFLQQSTTNQIVPNPLAGTGEPAPTNYRLLPGGGSIRANMTTRFFGKNVVYLDDAGAQAPLYQDTMEIAGDLLLDDYDPNVSLDNTSYVGPNSSSRANGEGQRASLIYNPPATGTTPKPNYVSPSSDTGSNGGFDTKNGLVRDDSGQNDANGLPRGITRLEPPVMNGVDPASSLPRYQALTMTSAPRNNPATGSAYQPGSSQYGYGQSIYINNADDIQTDSTTIGGGSTLVDEWLHQAPVANLATKGDWNGDFYQPPGVNITIGRQNVTPPSSSDSTYGLRMTLFDSASGQPALWKNPDGTASTSATMTVLYGELNASNDPAATTTGNRDNDVVLYAEGNIRVHGIVSADSADTAANVKDKLPRHITLVTNGTAYIEGNLLKGSPDSSITILAHDYVCVNTTQFLAGPQEDENTLGSPPPVGNSDPAYHALDFSQNDSLLVQEFNFGLPNGDTPLKHYGNNIQFGLYMSGRSEGGNGATEADVDLVNPVSGLDVNGNVPFTPLPAGSNLPPFFQPFNGNAQYFFNFTSILSNLVESDVNYLYIRRDPTAFLDSTALQNFEMQRAAILPMDIRIEAVLYAQTGSFFVIPGAWFNNNSSDTLDAYAATLSATNSDGTRPANTDGQFPFFGQPIDMKITIDGAVSEARPADISAQSAWMQKWGWIPQYHGGEIPDPTTPTNPPHTEQAGHLTKGAPAIGLQIIYNPQAGYPYTYDSGSGNGGYYLRSDAYGRPLPFTPNLPVSTGLLYSGQSGEAPLLQ